MRFANETQAGAASGIAGSQVDESPGGADYTSIDAALDSLRERTTRVVVLYASPEIAAVVMRRARNKGMVGRGWTWVGTDWVREYTWSHPLGRTEEGEDAIDGLLEGVVGVVPAEEDVYER